MTEQQAHALIQILSARTELRYNEYRLPDYFVIPVLGEEWAVRQVPFFYAGTIGAPKPGIVEREDWHDQAISDLIATWEK